MKIALLKIKRVLLQLLVLLACYFISRTCFFLFNKSSFEGLGLLSFLRLSFFALRYDISALLIINALYFFLFFLPVNISGNGKWERFTQIIFITSNSIALLFEISDWAYFPFNLKRSTADVLNMVSRRSDFISLLPHFVIAYWYVPAGCILLIALLIAVNNRIVRATSLKEYDKPGGIAYWFGQAFVFVAVGGLCIFGIRGGTNRIPIGIRDALKVTDSRYLPLVLNTPFSIINTFYVDKLPEVHYMSDEAARKCIDPVKKFQHTRFQKKNVVVIILESFSKEYTCLGGGKSYTPFLDSLMKQSLVCTNAYANALHSAEGIPAVIAGIPAFTDEPFTTSYYGTNRITSLPNTLKSEGYTSAFYHGGSNGTMNFDAFAASAGFDKYYGRNEYDNDADYDNAWGIWDEPFLQYFAKGMSNMKQPFFTTVFTLSSHDPFRIPQKYKGKLPTGNLPLETCIAYTDMSLKKFFATASRQPWFNNTIFVLTPDHAAPLHDNVNAVYYNGNMGVYAIPILFYAPGDTAIKGVNRDVVQQIDILPSVLDYLGYNRPFFALGNSIFSHGEHFVAERFMGCDQLLMDGYLLKTAEVTPKGLYSMPTDSDCVYNMLPDNTDLANDKLKYLKAFVQTYNDAMINNKMHAE